MFIRAQLLLVASFMCIFTSARPQCPYANQNIQTSAYYPRFRLPIPSSALQPQVQYSSNYVSSSVQPTVQVISPTREILQTSQQVLPSYSTTTSVETRPATQTYSASGYTSSNYPMMQHFISNSAQPTVQVVSPTREIVQTSQQVLPTYTKTTSVETRPATQTYSSSGYTSSNYPMMQNFVAASAPVVNAAPAPILSPLPAPIMSSLPAPITAPAVLPMPIPATTTCGQAVSSQVSSSSIQQVPIQIPNQPVQQITPCTQSRLIQPNCGCPTSTCGSPCSSGCGSPCATPYGK